MKNFGVLVVAAFLFFVMAGASFGGPIGSVTITFDEEGIVPYVDDDTPFTTDPGYNVNPLVFAGTQTGQLVFSGGDPNLLEDTFVVNSTSVSGNSLANGYLDVADWPGDSNSVIYLRSMYRLMTSVSAAFQFEATQDTRLILRGYDADDNLLAFTYVIQELGDDPWIHTIALSHPSGFAYVEFIGCYLDCSPFFIDNVEIQFAEGNGAIAEPVGILLLLPGIGGLVMRRRRRM